MTTDPADDNGPSARDRRRGRRVRRMGRSSEGELNIVSMIDVFAVLVFFLLVSAAIAAARLNVLGLSLPSNQPVTESKPLQRLTITLDRQDLRFTDMSGAVRRIPSKRGGYDLETLAGLLANAKRKAPAEENITLLVHPDVAYEHVIRVMDVARGTPAGAAPGRGRLFPAISVGEMS
jgi:biopolymer transport protein ExbD